MMSIPSAIESRRSEALRKRAGVIEFLMSVRALGRDDRWCSRRTTSAATVVRLECEARAKDDVRHPTHSRTSAWRWRGKLCQPVIKRLAQVFVMIG
jgi:hypothetical protein